MSDITADSMRMEAQALVKSAAIGGSPGEGVQAAIRRAATRLGLRFNRAKKYWYGEIQNPPAHELELLRIKAGHRSTLNTDIQALRSEIDALKRGHIEGAHETNAGGRSDPLLALAEACVRLAEKIAEEKP